MRTFEEVWADTQKAMSINDAEALLRLADELDALYTTEASAISKHARGWTAHLQGDVVNALDYFHQAKMLHQKVADATGMAKALANIGVVHQSTDNYPLALEHFHRALGIHEELGNRDGVALILGNLGLLYHGTDNYPLALEFYHRALALHEELQERPRVANVLGNMGGVYSDMGNYALALEFYNRSLSMHEDVGSRTGASIVLCNIGEVHTQLGNLTKALEYFRNSKTIAESLGDTSVLAIISSNLGNALVVSEQYSAAEELLRVMDAMHVSNSEVLIEREKIRAAIHVHRDEIEAAIATLLASLEIAKQNSKALCEAEIHKRLRDLALKKNDLLGYVSHNNEYTRITQGINGKETATKLALQEAERRISTERQEHQKHMAVLHSTLPKHIADRVARGEVVTDHFENASVMFLDIVGFTAISDRIPSGHVVHLLEQIFTTLDVVSEKHNVVKIKTIGDSYMAVSFDSVSNAATCALEMITALDALEITVPPALGDTSWTQEIGDIQVRIGMHCGPVTAGVIGTARMQYDVWGDTVNVASRMESTSEPGRIHVSEAFAKALRSGDTASDTTSDTASDPMSDTIVDNVKIWRRGEIEVKGKGTMKTYWLESNTQ